MKIIKTKINRPITNPEDMKSESVAYIAEFEEESTQPKKGDG